MSSAVGYAKNDADLAGDLKAKQSITSQELNEITIRILPDGNSKHKTSRPWDLTEQVKILYKNANYDVNKIINQKKSYLLEQEITVQESEVMKVNRSFLDVTIKTSGMVYAPKCDEAKHKETGIRLACKAHCSSFILASRSPIFYKLFHDIREPKNDNKINPFSKTKPPLVKYDFRHITLKFHPKLVKVMNPFLWWLHTNEVILRPSLIPLFILCVQLFEIPTAPGFFQELAEKGLYKYQEVDPPDTNDGVDSVANKYRLICPSYFFEKFTELAVATPDKLVCETESSKKSSEVKSRPLLADPPKGFGDPPNELSKRKHNHVPKIALPARPGVSIVHPMNPNQQLNIVPANSFSTSVPYSGTIPGPRSIAPQQFHPNRFSTQTTATSSSHLPSPGFGFDTWSPGMNVDANTDLSKNLPNLPNPGAGFETWQPRNPKFPKIPEPQIPITDPKIPINDPTIPINEPKIPINDPAPRILDNGDDSDDKSDRSHLSLGSEEKENDLSLPAHEAELESPGPSENTSLIVPSKRQKLINVRPDLNLPPPNFC